MFNWKWRDEPPPVVIWQGEKFRLVASGSSVFVEIASRDRMETIHWSGDGVALRIIQGQIVSAAGLPGFLPELLEDAQRLAKAAEERPRNGE